PAAAGPAATRTLTGTVAAAALVLLSVTTVPPVAAVELRITVPVDALPPGTVAGSSVTDETPGGMTVSCTLRVTPPDVPEIVTITVDNVTVLVVTAKLAVVEPGGTVTFAGTATTAGWLLTRLTTVPPAAAAALTVAVPDANAPLTTMLGLTCRSARAVGGGITVSTADFVTPPYVANIVTGVATATGAVMIPTSAVIPPVVAWTPSALGNAIDRLLLEK